MAVAAFVVAGAAAYLVGELRQGPHVVAGTGTKDSGSLPTSGTLPAAGALVPAFDLWSDPVFPSLSVGYAIERHLTSGGSSEALARSEDGGRTWHLVGQFPFSTGYAEVEFISVSTGYAFGPAGLAVTRDGGAHWTEGQALGGRLQRVIPIGSNVWATFEVCHGPPEPATICDVRLAESTDSGLNWTTAPGLAPLEQSFDGGDVLARVSSDAAYLVSYGVTGGALAYTSDGGRSWTGLADPCSAWPVVDLAAPAPGMLWMVCGEGQGQGGAAGAGSLAGASGGAGASGAATGSAKAAFQSTDGGRTWKAEAYTGFGPPSGPLADRAPFGRLSYEGRLSQLATIDPYRAWIGVAGLGVLVTSDHGRVWSLASGMSRPGGSAGIGVTFDDARHGWAIEFRSGVWQTTDGVHWRLVDGT